MDDIQRKLALIDKQLTGGPANFHKQIISTAPLLFVAVGLIAGILLQSGFNLSIWLWLIFLALCTIATALIFAIQRKNKLGSNAPVLLSSCALICFVCLGAIRLSSFHQPKLNDIRNFVADERKLATVRGVIVTEPYINRNKDWEFVKFKFTDPASSFYLKIHEVKTVDGWAEAAGTVRVQVDEPVLDLKMGDYVQMYCWLDRFKGPTNPGQFNVSQYLARKNVFIAASVNSRDGIEILRFAQNDKWSSVFLQK